jgi:hypothetical protein
MTSNLVFAFTGRGANDAIRGLMAEYADALGTLGLSVVEINVLEAAELQYVVEQMAAGHVAFGLTWLGVGQDLAVTESGTGRRRNAWEAFGLPLLKLHGDLPAYFSDYHRDAPRTTVNLYHAAEFLRFWSDWLPHERALTVQIPPLPLSPLHQNSIDRATRKRGKLVFLKNGNSPEQLCALWRERLTPGVARIIQSLAEAIAPVGLRAGPLLIGDFVARFLECEVQADRKSVADLVLFFTAQMDDFLRRLKSDMIARAVLDLPVLVQGNLWDHIDFTGRAAQRVDGLDYRETLSVYREQLGIIDMSPNVDTWPHDRIQRAAGSFTAFLTNRQGWLTEQFAGFDDLMFEFSEDSIRTRVSAAIARPDHYLDLGAAFGSQFRERYTREGFARRLADAAELARLSGRPDRPTIQPFFVWPRTAVGWPAP